MYSSSLFAPGFAGRWNSEGKKVIYTAESIPLAFMENMIRRKGLGFNDQFRVMIIEVPGTLSVTEIDPADLSTGWRDYTDYSICQRAGNKWYDKGLTPVLKVPSAILPMNFNYVLHSLHRDFGAIKIIGTTELIPDQRIEDLLKKSMR